MPMSKFRDVRDRRIPSESNNTGNEVRAARDGQSVEDDIRALITSQMRGHFDPVEEGLMKSLDHCLRSDNRVSSASLCGYVDHFQTASDDAGWGCGWRNIQMLCSFLLSEVPEAREVLFNGIGFVPDIPSLQRWLEIAWQKGFDQSGAVYYNWNIYGTRKWIGTTECAALLRAFGIRVMIVSFTAIGDGGSDGTNDICRVTGSGDVKGNKRTGIKRATPDQEAQRYGIECDECGRSVAHGFRYRGLVNKECDLCSDCMTKRKKRQSPGSDERLSVDGWVSAGEKKFASTEQLDCTSRSKGEGPDCDQRGTENLSETSRQDHESNTDRSLEGHLQKHNHVGEKGGAERNANGKDRANGVTDSSSQGVQKHRFSCQNAEAEEWMEDNR